MKRTAAALLVAIIAGCSALPPAADVQVRLEPVANGLDQPVGLAANATGALFLIEQPGRVLHLKTDGTSTPFLDIRDRVGSGGERGLLGLAFPGQGNAFYVHYTDTHGDTVISRFHAANGSTDAEREEILLQQDQPYPNHNGGQIAFGPDGHLYVGLGDGGGAGDPHGNAQSLNTLLGKILRIHVEETGAPTIPSGNPFSGDDQRREIWAYGLRNPWRFSFDHATGDLWIGDVGQNSWEEVDRLAAGSPAGANLGWNRFEGTHRFRAGAITDHVGPVYEYQTGPGGTCAVTGGYVYRGERIPDLRGAYVFADYCDGDLRILIPSPAGLTPRTLLTTELKVSSFGEDAQGELYVLDRGGAVYRLAPA